MNRVGAYIVRRLGLAVLQIVLVATLVFAFLHLLPGDPVLVVLGSERSVTPEQVEAYRHELGLDRPLWEQYGRWIGGLARLDLGTSLVDKEPVIRSISARLPRTLELVGVASCLAVAVAIPMGVAAALRRGSTLDWLLTATAATGISVPVYVVGSLLVLLFSIKLGLLPAGGYTELAEDPHRHLLQLILPSVTLAFNMAATITRMTRSSLLEVLGQDYVRTARAKGLPERRVIYRHALRTSLIAVVTVIGVQVGSLIGGTVLVESIFNWPGLSTLLTNSIARRDYPMVQGIILVTATLMILINLTVDLLYGVLDPRIRYS